MLIPCRYRWTKNNNYWYCFSYSWISWIYAGRFCWSWFIICRVRISNFWNYHKTSKKGQFSIVDFYQRELKRIYPALFLMMIFVCHRDPSHHGHHLVCQPEKSLSRLLGLDSYLLIDLHLDGWSYSFDKKTHNFLKIIRFYR